MKFLSSRKNTKKDFYKDFNGFTLIEVLMALAIFSIGILGVASMQLSSTNGNTKARKYSEASAYTQGRVELLMTETFDDVVDGNLLTDDGYTVQWTVVDQIDIDGFAGADMKVIQVTVNDPEGIQRTSYTFSKFFAF